MEAILRKANYRKYLKRSRKDFVEFVAYNYLKLTEIERKVFEELSKEKKEEYEKQEAFRKRNETNLSKSTNSVECFKFSGKPTENFPFTIVRGRVSFLFYFLFI